VPDFRIRPATSKKTGENCWATRPPSVPCSIACYTTTRASVRSANWYTKTDLPPQEAAG
jgi:hypothetical protein